MVDSDGKARVGLLTLMFDLYDAIPGLESEMGGFGAELADILSAFAEVEWPGVCKNRSMADGALDRFHKGGSDLIVVVFLTYAPSQIALRGLRDSRIPILLLNTQRLPGVGPEMNPEELIRNHGVHGVQDIANALTRAGGRFSVLTGHYMDPEIHRELREWCVAAQAARRLLNLKVGAIGPALQGMGDFALDDTILLSELGVEVIHIPQRSVAERATQAPGEEINAQLDSDRREFHVAENVTTAEHEESLRLEWALRRVLSDRGMEAFSANFMSIGEEGHLRTLPFLAASKMLRDGYGYAGEGDVLTAVAVRLMHWLAGAANFTEMFTMDFAGGSLLMSHMGEGNPALAREDAPVELVRSQLGLVEMPVSPLLLRFSLKPGPVTLVNLTVGASRKLKMIAAEGEVVDFPVIGGVMTPHFKFRPEKSLPDFLSELATEGSSHHFALAYGSWSRLVTKLAKILDIEFSRV